MHSTRSEREHEKVGAIMHECSVWSVLGNHVRFS